MPHTAPSSSRARQSEETSDTGLINIGSSTNAMRAVQFLVRRYGQLAFGVITLLVIYQIMLRPMLQDQKVDVAALREVASSMKDTAEASKATAEANKTVAQSLQVVGQNLHTTAEILDRVTRRIDHANAP